MFRVTHRNTAHVVIVLAVVSLILLVPAAPALAHATLIGAEPSPNTGTGLSNAPTTVRLRLSEPVRVPPSTIAVLDRSGRDVATRVRRVPTDPQSMEADLPSLSQGVYRVVWRSVSALDGHTIRGAYFFGVGEPPP